jgi:ABC-type multidrug transport system fused ATPase/permease subunit
MKQETTGPSPAGGNGCAAADPAEAQEIVFDRVVKTYQGAETPAVDELSLTVPAGEICVLHGPSVSGKP